MLRSCWAAKNIVINSSSVKQLVLTGLSNVEKIPALHLLSMVAAGTDAEFKLDNISSLIDLSSPWHFSLSSRGIIVNAYGISYW